MATVASPVASGNSASVVTPAGPQSPRFVVQHTRPCRYQLVDKFASSTAKSVVGDYTDFDAARAERDRLNTEYFAQVAL